MWAFVLVLEQDMAVGRGGAGGGGAIAPPQYFANPKN